MPDIFGNISGDDLDQSNQAHAVNCLAIALALVEKGILTMEELNHARAKATHMVEQEFARMQSKAQDRHS